MYRHLEFVVKTSPRRKDAPVLPLPDMVLPI
jgi:hypothetical protein